MAIVAALLALVGPARAQQLLEGLTGSQCSARGGRITVWTNTAGVGPNVGECYIPPRINGGGSVSNGGGGSMGSAAAGLGAAATIFSALSDLMEASQAESADASRQTAEADLLRRAGEANALGLTAYGSGDFDAAIADFMEAANVAGQVHGAVDIRNAYLRNAHLAEARKTLARAEDLYHAGDYADASREYLLAAQKAQFAGAPEVAAMVRSYHQRMMAALSGSPASARQGVQGADAHCEMINGSMMCEDSGTAAAPAPAEASANAMFTPPASCGSTITSADMPAVSSSNCPPQGRAAAAPTRPASGASQSGPLIRKQRSQVAAAQNTLDQALVSLKDLLAQRLPPEQLGELPKILAGLPPETDEGLECGNAHGRRHNGQCVAPWSESADACVTKHGGTYYPADADHRTAVCAYDAKANPMTAYPGPHEGEPCGDAGGHTHGGACWVLGVTRQDCRDLLHGLTVDSGGYQYCAYDAGQLAKEEKAAEAASAALHKRKALSDKLKKMMASSDTDADAESDAAAPTTSGPGSAKTAAATEPVAEPARAEAWMPHYTCRAPDGRVFGTDDPMTVPGYDPTHSFCRLDNSPAITGLTPNSAGN